MAALRRLVFAALMVLFMLLAAVFAYSNPQPIDIDIGVAKLSQVPMSIAFAVTFALGWIFGLIAAALSLLQAAGERRRLRKELQYTEAELATLRSVPLQDAN